MPETFTEVPRLILSILKSKIFLPLITIWRLSEVEPSFNERNLIFSFPRFAKIQPSIVY